MPYEWNDAKRRANLRKHGLDFADVEAGFDWDTALVLPMEIVDGERREREIGQLGGRVVFLVYTTRENMTRLISLRVATRKEQRFYVDNS